MIKRIMTTLKRQYEIEKDWKQRCMLLEIIHLSMIQKHKENWTIKSTAQFIGKSVGAVSEDLQLAESLHMMFGLEACTSRNKALKTMRKDRRKK